METLDCRLVLAAVGGCTCGTKTPDIGYHDDMCHYRLFIESHDLIEDCEKRIIDYFYESSNGVVQVKPSSEGGDPVAFLINSHKKLYAKLCSLENSA